VVDSHHAVEANHGRAPIIKWCCNAKRIGGDNLPAAHATVYQPLRADMGCYWVVLGEMSPEDALDGLG
jgi:hypothetical protein